jgi:beta-lactamase superfamily II metal-dependent hydrolase
LLEDYEIREIVLKGKDINLDLISLDYLDFNQNNIDDNDSSLIYTMNLLNTRFLFMGDLSTKGEFQLQYDYPYLKTDILKIGHHGSKTSTSDEFIKQVQARVGLISVGTNVYGHPNFEVLNRLSDYFIVTLDSKTQGDIQILLTPILRIIKDSKLSIYLF